MATGPRVAVIGGGWAGLAAAVEATQAGAQVSVFEMAGQLGGRAREVRIDGHALDNGQHICIGAYRETLRLLELVGVDPGKAFLRLPLGLHRPDRRGLALRSGPALWSFAAAVLRHPFWRLKDKLDLLAEASRWFTAGFRCNPALTVARLTSRLPGAVRDELIDPLCVAALNTPSESASATVFLRILRDALFSGPGAADLLLPKVGLSTLFPSPCEGWLRHRGAEVKLRHRVARLSRGPGRWLVDDQPFDTVILAASPRESARIVEPLAPAWAAMAAGLTYEPIVTVYLRSEGCVLPEPMFALVANDVAPAQFVFDRGQLGGPRGLLAFVVSGATSWLKAGTAETLRATRRQAESALGTWLRAPLQEVQVIVERRATFACTPALIRPAMAIAPSLLAAGDHVEGPYPATLEGAIRSGVTAARASLR